MRRLRTGLVLTVVALGVAASTASCNRGGGDDAVVLQVSAASSLTEAFSALRDAYVAKFPDVDVELSFASSAVIAQQANELAPIDVVATADVRSMATMVDRGSAKDPRIFARNRLTMVVERGNPKGIASLADLAEPGTLVVLCADTAPCGRYAAAALAAASVSLPSPSREENVKSVVSKVALGEADAGIVYETDARAAAGTVEAVAIPGADDDSLEATYPIAVTTAGDDHDAAADWVELVLSDEGRRILADLGFLDP